MQPRPDPRCWVIIAHRHSRLDPVTGAPPRYKRAGQCRIEEIDRSGVVGSPRVPECVIAQPSAPQFSSSQVVHSGIPLAETAGRNGDPDVDRETTFGDRDHLARVAWHRVFLVCSKR
jgi:hypothetical protein